MLDERCKFCRWSNGQHSNDCSRNEPDAEEQYVLGYQRGRSGKLIDPENTHPSYKAGYLAGEIAYEEWYNGDPDWGW